MEGASVVLVELEIVTAVVVSAAVKVKLVLVGSSSFASPDTLYTVSSSKLEQSRSGLRGLRSPAAMPQLSAKVSHTRAGVANTGKSTGIAVDTAMRESVLNGACSKQFRQKG